MFIWTAVNVEGQLMDLRNKVSLLSKSLNASNSALTLPLHISLRMSFQTDDPVQEEVMSRVRQYLLTLSAFEVGVLGIERHTNVVWINIARNMELERIHDTLVDTLLTEYGIQPHAYDRGFRFHVTLWMDGDALKADEAYLRLKDAPLPGRLSADRFLVGCSRTGKPGEFSVVQEIAASPGAGRRVSRGKTPSLT